MRKKIISTIIIICLVVINCNTINAEIFHENEDIHVTDDRNMNEIKENTKGKEKIGLNELENSSSYNAYIMENEQVEFKDDNKITKQYYVLDNMKNILLEKAYITENEQDIFEYTDTSKENIINDITKKSIKSNEVLQEAGIEEDEVFLKNKFSEKISKELGISLEAKDIIVYIADTYILCFFEEGIYRYGYMYLNNGRINKNISCMVDGKLYSASNINNENISYGESVENNTDFGVSDADREEFMLDLRQGLVPKMEVYTLEYIAEYIKNKHLESTYQMTDSSAFNSMQSVKKRVYLAGPVTDSQFKYVLPSINSPSSTVNTIMPNTKQYTKNSSDIYTLKMYDFYADYVEQVPSHGLEFAAGAKTVLDIATLFFKLPEAMSALLSAAGVAFDAVTGVIADSVYYVVEGGYSVSQYRQSVVWDNSFTNGYINLHYLYRWITAVHVAGYQDGQGNYHNPHWGQLTGEETTFEYAGLQFDYSQMEEFARWTLGYYINACQVDGYWKSSANVGSIATVISKGLILPEHQHTITQDSEYMMLYNKNCHPILKDFDI